MPEAVKGIWVITESTEATPIATDGSKGPIDIGPSYGSSPDKQVSVFCRVRS